MHSASHQQIQAKCVDFIFPHKKKLNDRDACVRNKLFFRYAPNYYDVRFRFFLNLFRAQSKKIGNIYEFPSSEYYSCIHSNDRDRDESRHRQCDVGFICNLNVGYRRG